MVARFDFAFRDVINNDISCSISIPWIGNEESQKYRYVSFPHTHTMAEKKLKHVFDRQRFEWNASWALGCQWNTWEKFCHRISKNGSAQKFCLLEKSPHAKFELNRTSLSGPPKRSKFGFFDPWKISKGGGTWNFRNRNFFFDARCLRNAWNVEIWCYLENFFFEKIDLLGLSKFLSWGSELNLKWTIWIQLLRNSRQ